VTIKDHVHNWSFPPGWPKDIQEQHVTDLGLPKARRPWAKVAICGECDAVLTAPTDHLPPLGRTQTSYTIVVDRTRAKD
jgi:hypothetical protein